MTVFESINNLTISSTHESIRVALRLVWSLRDAGLKIGVDRSRAFIDAVARSGDLYWAGRLTLVGSRDDLRIYDQVFRRLVEFHESEVRHPSEESAKTVKTVLEAYETDTEMAETEPSVASRIERLRARPFDQLTSMELNELARALRFVRLNPMTRLTRSRSASTDGSLDLRRMVRDMHRHGGEVMPPRWRAPLKRPQQLTFLLDVSGSMSTTSRGLLLATALFVRSDNRHFAFTVGTRLTSVTRSLREGGLTDALDVVADESIDRDGGTRLGACFRELLREHRHSRTVRGTILVIYSDGLERGDPDLLGEQMKRLSLLARKVIWMNPLSADSGYEPLARGMRIAMPHIDTFAAGQDLDTFQHVVESAVIETSTVAKGSHSFRSEAIRPT